MQNDKKTGFLGTYFDRDSVVKLARLAGILGWLLLGSYAYMTVISLFQYLTFVLSDVIVLENMTVIDRLSIPNTYIQQLAPGLIYFIMMKAVQQVLLILLDIEDNSRRAARARAAE